MRAFFNYYKWHIFFFALFIFCISFFVFQSCSKIEPDLEIKCVTTTQIDVQEFKDRKSNRIEAYLLDADEDGKKQATLESYTYDRQSDLDEVMLSVCKPDDCDIVIATKETFENFEEKGLFVTSTDYLKDAANEKYNVLKDSSERIYAISIKDNEFLEELGFRDTDNLYIAVVDEESPTGELPSVKKNSRNIAQLIVKEGNI